MAAHLLLNTGALGLQNVSDDERIALAKKHGFDAVDVGIGSSDAEADAIKAKLDAAGLRPGMFGLPAGLYAKDEEFDAGIAKLPDIARRAKRLGITRTGCYMMCACKDKSYAETLAWHLDRFRRLTAILHPLGIELGIEFLGEHLVSKIGGEPFIYNMAGMRKLLAEIGPGAGVIFDVFHWYCSGGEMSRLRDEAAGVPITVIHLNDAVAERSRLEQIDNDRRLPGETGVTNSGAAVRILESLGFDGPMMVEPFKPWTTRFAECGPEAACETTARYVRVAMANE